MPKIKLLIQMSNYLPILQIGFVKGQAVVFSLAPQQIHPQQCYAGIVALPDAELLRGNVKSPPASMPP